jgi:hypothetical protein
MDERTPSLNKHDELEIWREALAHLRHLSDDVWKGLKLFLALNSVLLIIIAGLLVLLPLNHGIGFLLALVSVVGALLTLAARFILKRHRIYYLQMLAKKSLLEDEFGFYQTKLAGTDTDLAFPWRLTPEVVAEIKQNSEAWIQKSIRAKGTIARVQFLIYEVLIGLHAFIFVIAMLRLLRRV